MNSPMKTQRGGSHYKGLGIEPFEFAMANRYDPCAFSTMKYIARHHLKGGAEDLRKAAHINSIRAHQISRYGPPERALTVITPGRFCSANNLPHRETAAIASLHRWVTPPHMGPLGRALTRWGVIADCPDDHAAAAEALNRLIETIIRNTYGEIS